MNDRKEGNMIIRNINGPEAVATTYIAHEGGMARMLLTSNLLTSMEFFAYAVVPAGTELSEHIDPLEEIYFILYGSGLMRVGDDEREVGAGDAIWIPVGDRHSLKNTGTDTMAIVVVAAYPTR
jgi:mannose-6-phosphate isomerase-like protein (cupin superfamily)